MKKRIRITAIAAAIAVACAVTVYAAYDSSKDPIVSLSYLTDVFKPALKADLDSSVASAKSSLEASINSSVASAKTSLESSIKSSVESAKTSLESDVDSAVASAVAAAKESLKQELSAKIESDYAATFDAIQNQLDILSNSYETVTLEKNKRLTASAACEIVILSGSATVRSSAADGGIIDCTDGVILYDGQNIPLNHKLLVPDNGDGRGFLATGAVQLLIKGGYTVG